MYIWVKDIKPGLEFRFENNTYKVLEEQAKNPLEVKCYCINQNRTVCLPRYSEVPVANPEVWREMSK